MTLKYYEKNSITHLIAIFAIPISIIDKSVFNVKKPITMHSIKM